MFDEADGKAAHAFLCELRTHVATQPLAYQHGVEARVFESINELFALARAAMKEYPGAARFAQSTTDVLNAVVRPLTAKWQRAHEAGWLASRDGGDEFRADLARVQSQLRDFASQLGEMAYGTPVHDRLVEPPLPESTIEALFAPLPYGIPTDPAHNGGIEPPGGRRAKVEPTQVAAINTSERAAIDARRQALRRAADDDAVGLALSGGGIRSAIFCLGVTQVLAERKLLRHVDYLSTVSGGGYTGCFLTSVLANDGDESHLAAPHGPDPKPIQQLRRHAQFLKQHGLWSSWRMVIETVLGMLFNWCVPLILILGFAVASVVVKRNLARDTLWPPIVIVAVTAMVLSGLAFFWRERSRQSSTVPGKLMLLSSVVAACTLGIWALDWGFGVLFPDLDGLARSQVKGLLTHVDGITPYQLEQVVASGADEAAIRRSLTVVAGVTESDIEKLAKVDHSRWTCRQVRDALAALLTVGWQQVMALGAAVVATLLPAGLRFLPLFERPLVRKVVLMAALAVGGLLVPLLGIATFYVLYAFGAVRLEGGGFWANWAGWFCLVGATLLLTTIVVVFLNINTTGPHRLYRRGLSRSFVDNGRNQAPRVELAAFNAKCLAPYHLINTAINLPASDNERLRERSCDFFLFSRLWTGSPIVGYHPTKEWKMDGAGADVSTAMAISGAAVSSNMGLGSIAPLRALLAFLNVRLGYWMRRRDRGGLKSRFAGEHPGFLCLLREMTAIDMDEQSEWYNLSDGGHIENLGVYELLRRRCKFIVCVDGEADPAHTFHGLMTMVRHAQIDFGAEIELDLADLRPDAKTGHCRSHYHLGRIRYAADRPGERGPVGLLLYVKLSLTGNESELIRRYRGNNPSFPHQSTLDQFFDEEQFEAYRQLGVHIAEGLFSPSLLTEDPKKEPNLRPASVKQWFRALARNLLTPEPKAAGTTSSAAPSHP